MIVPPAGVFDIPGPVHPPARVPKETPSMVMFVANCELAFIPTMYTNNIIGLPVLLVYVTPEVRVTVCQVCPTPILGDDETTD